MPTLTVRNLDTDVTDAIKQRAKQNGNSMEAEVRRILVRTTKDWQDKQHVPESGRDMLKRIHSRFAVVNGADDLADMIDGLPHTPLSEPISFDK